MHTTFNLLVWGALGLYVLLHFIKSVRLVPTQTALIVERLGKYHATLGPGFHFLLPFIDRVAYERDLKEEAIDVPPQECFTKDNVLVEVDGILYLSVVDPVAASYGITSYRFAAIQLVQTTTRSVIGTLDLDHTFEERDAINARVLAALEEVGASWGIRVHRYEVKGIVPPVSVRNAMERQMTAERERRALLARSEGEKATRINNSEGAKQEAINRSEGEKRRRINEAEGRAQEILSLARATAESIETMGASLASPGGTEAARLRLAQQYMEQFSQLARPDTKVVLPADLMRIDEVLATVELDAEKPDRPVIARPPGPRPRPAPEPSPGLATPAATARATPLQRPASTDMTSPLLSPPPATPPRRE